MPPRRQSTCLCQGLRSSDWYSSIYWYLWYGYTSMILMVRTSQDDLKFWGKMLTSSNRWWQLDMVKFRQKSLDPILPDTGIPERLKVAWELEDGLNSKHSRCKMLFQKIPEARAHIQTKGWQGKGSSSNGHTDSRENPTSKMNWWRF